jgi:hypothetical protein
MADLSVLLTDDVVRSTKHACDCGLLIGADGIAMSGMWNDAPFFSVSYFNLFFRF